MAIPESLFYGKTRVYNLEGALINELKSGKDFAYYPKFIQGGEYLYVETVDSFKVWLVDHSKILDELGWILD